ncbi:MAG: anthranilate phosphoribosyltransferase [Gammaproteobacteria bacterium]|nr:anthranilate phosphoribosyltransferase [Gammaproteobacteria bacterium]
MDIQQAIQKVIDRQDLTPGEMCAVMTTIMNGGATPAQIGGFLVGLRMKGETIDEIAAAAQVMRSLAAKVKTSVPHLVDVVGTGGDRSNTFNVSTTSAFVVAAAGGNVAKHGNRSVSSKSGSADLLEAAGASLALSPEQIACCIEEVGVGFMFAPAHHGAMKHAIGPRREMAVRTIFNVLGPLTNPADAPTQLVGVFAKELVEPIANVLSMLGSRHALVVHSEDGLDEISIGAPTWVAELKDGKVSTYSVSPEELGVTVGDVARLTVTSAEESLVLVQAALNNEPGPARDIVVLNAGAALYACGIYKDLPAGVEAAAAAVESGAAKSKLAQFVAFTNDAVNDTAAPG